MIKPLINAVIFVLGIAGVALVGYLSAEPLAFTRPLPERPPLRELPSMAADRSPAVIPASLDSEAGSIWLPEVRITGAPPRAEKRPVVSARFDPCSEWREVGAQVANPAGATGVHNVRALCAQPDDER